MKNRISKWVDLVDRVAWTAIQTSLGVIGGTAIDGDLNWTVIGWSCLIASAACASKVMAAQSVGDSGLGDAVPGASVIKAARKR